MENQSSKSEDEIKRGDRKDSLDDESKSSYEEKKKHSNRRIG